MGLEECSCIQCGEKFQEDIPGVGDFEVVSFCERCVDLGIDVHIFTKHYKELNNIPEDEEILVVSIGKVPRAIVREVDVPEVVEWCEAKGINIETRTKRINGD